MLIFGLTFSCLAAEYPSRNVKAVVPWASGGGAADLASRVMAKYMSPYLGVSLVVENMPGASSQIGVKYLRDSKPDGYTIGSGISTSNLLFYPKLVKGSGISKGSITPLFRYCNVINYFVVRQDSPWNTFKDYVADIKKNPRKFKHTSPGAQSLGNVSVELINKHVGTETLHVPFQSTGQGLTALLGGHVDMVSAHGLGGGLLQANKIKVLALASPERVDFLPNVPTLKELGYPIALEQEHGMFIPNGTPREIQDKLIDAGKKAFKEHGEEINKLFADMYLSARWLDQEDFKKLMDQNEITYNDLLKVLNIPTEK